MAEQAQRSPEGRFLPGISGNPAGPRRQRERARLEEIERQAEEQRLLGDLGREPSHSERLIVEQLTTLIVRGRALRAAGRGADAEMVARLVMRGMSKLGIRQGKPQTHQSSTTAERIAAIGAARKAAEAAS